MNLISSITAAVATLAAAGSMLAQSAPSAGLTRAEVIAEFQRARANGDIAYSEADYAKLPANTSSVTRQQVMDEFYAARKSGKIAQTEADFDVAHSRTPTLK
ncbi:DUF4148 domain-containing protein [Janthinobacterium agaricidamnosum]|uniref:DUF4148 domain-containing protein n=1 Tax=Janthinobacterium agaricidamnosum NBRC 102515 = DSM 9628 TaxID=1349767 RepID=W0VBC5_9BURK|nr:DUF4148 domain-containing protein [Janthinobacterium agaricidamnosum]CDG84658.1 hypothetical protein GJA_4048 [Janthinobacterium agaricidamnosum NBRC 102515 = DSM 9628]